MMYQNNDTLFFITVILFTGILYTPVGKFGHNSLNVSMRKDLDIYASVALVKNYAGAHARHQQVDFAIIRENTEGEYSGLAHQVEQHIDSDGTMVHPYMIRLHGSSIYVSSSWYLHDSSLCYLHDSYL